MNCISIHCVVPRAGSVLVLVLIVLSSMIILSVGLTYRTQIEMRLAYANAERTQSYYLALGGIERAKALLSEQKLSPLRVARVCRFAATAREERLFEQLEDFDPDAGRFLMFSLRDEKGYLNLNRSDPASWTDIDCVGEELSSAILDWIDGDHDVGPGGAETDFYEGLAPPYISKDAPVVALKELLLIKGVTRDTYVGEDLNRNSSLDETERDGRLRLPFDNEDSKLDVGLLDTFTVYGNGRLNINTTGGAILRALPGLDDEAAEHLLIYRAGPDGQEGTEDDGFFASGEDFAKVEGLTELQVELLRQYCCFDSDHFRVFSCAGLNNTFKCCLMATIKYTESQPQILYLERLL